MKDKRKRWMINDDQGHPSDWPITLSYGLSEKCPLWVWGDRKLSRKLVRLLNENKISPTSTNHGSRNKTARS